MKSSVTGAGSLGAGHPPTLAQMGREVIGLDTDAALIAHLANGTAPFHEPDLADLLQEGHDSGRLTVTADPEDPAEAEVHFLCLGTPRSKAVIDLDLSILLTSIEALLPHLRSAVSRVAV
jgi:UDPglucose 6-dehydrogenase